MASAKYRNFRSDRVVKLTEIRRIDFGASGIHRQRPGYAASLRDAFAFNRLNEITLIDAGKPFVHVVAAGFENRAQKQSPPPRWEYRGLLSPAGTPAYYRRANSPRRLSERRRTPAGNQRKSELHPPFHRVVNTIQTVGFAALRRESASPRPASRACAASISPWA